MGCTGCSSPDKDEQASSRRVVRVIEPPDGQLSTAQVPRVEIASESRMVVLAQPRRVLRWRETVKLDRTLFPVELRRPVDLPGVKVQADVVISVGTLEGGSLLEQRATDSARRWLQATGGLAASEDVQTLEVPIPDDLVGRDALLDLVVRPLPEGSSQELDVPALDVLPNHELRFGYGVEPTAWGPGWPPVRFTVEARVEGEDTPRVLFERTVDPVDDPRDRRWYDAVVDLSPFAHRRISLRLEQRAVSADDSARTFAVISNPIVASRALRHSGDAQNRPWNVILVSLDTLRAPSLSGYGYARPTSPRLDADVAARGARVTRVVAPRPFTPPSHMTMLTGLEPCAHGVEDRDDVLGANHLTLAERLRDAGYATAAFTEDAYVVGAAGFARGFDRYHELRSEESASPGFAAETFGAASEWLRQVDDRPFFLFVHTYQVHEPYTPPKGMRVLVDAALPNDPVPAANREARDAYDQEIRYTDELLADFLGVLSAAGLADRTILVVTSDHGEQFGEHFWTGHGFSTYDEAVLVPMLIRAPGLVPAGRVVDTQVGLVDLVPTLLDLLGLDVTPELQGQSFAPLLRGSDPDRARELAERPVFLSALNDDAVTTPRFKVMQPRKGRNRRMMLYLLDEDPGERQNAAASHPELVTQARMLLAEHEKSCATWRERYPAGAGADLHGATLPGWFVNRQEIDAKLRSLGYVR